MTPPPLAEWPGAEIAPGVAFQGDGSLTLEAGESGLPVLSFWRPILFREETDEPIAGRMDCKVVAAEQPYDEAAFDPDAKHAATAGARERQGFIDEDVLRDIGEHTRRLDVVGRRNAPHQHYVLSYILVRDGARMIDIRRNCTFVHGKGITKIDALPYVYRYTKLTYGFEPNGATG
ncbi:carbamoyl-phosphate synthase large subunit [Erythrobacter sp.]|uniref:carbamoyl-phosphate synthase large subunit n=1 Tax=Erythrobacter sp. TaxID=1042 RepID=UPI001425FECF|nr:carbamoyl-phosphate synthase large subunit [Erythrobacter sp.]QIQ88113.1 MAG: carbamoyl-phosphate synthase large subunit [Erythrobacter sp.]